MTSGKLTPMMQQYYALKRKYPDALLLFQMGDFFECFEKDAEILSQVLGIALTSRGKNNKTPLAGIPIHSLDQYLPKLLTAGYKVAICEQLEDPVAGKLVKRGVTRIVTPGTATEESFLQKGENNYLATLFVNSRKKQLHAGLAVVDVSTGEFFTEHFSSTTEKELLEQIISELNKFSPTEILLPDYEASNLISRLCRKLELKIKEEIAEVIIYRLPTSNFAKESAESQLLRKFELHTIEGLGYQQEPETIQAAGALLGYIESLNPHLIGNLRRPIKLTQKDFLILDTATQKNLELMKNLYDGTTEGTLFSVLNKTVTPMGQRLLKKWILRPLVKKEHIEERLNIVESLKKDFLFLNEVRERLKHIADIERLITKINQGTGTPRDLISLEQSLQACKMFKELLQQSPAAESFHSFYQLIDKKEINEIITTISNSISPTAPNTLKDGNVIKDGFNKTLDELRELVAHSKEIIAKTEIEERLRTGVKNLKIGYNKVFGYYIEITKAALKQAKIPDDYIRKQTLVNAERFISPKLKELEEKILTANEKMIALETELFHEIRTKIGSHIELIQQVASHIAQLDVLASFAYLAEEYHYVRPIIDESTTIEIKEGRHPVVEILQADKEFVPNDIYLDTEKEQIAIITGPNMSGKSTFIRQVALITLLAQMGSFVPATYARIGIIDQLFTRLGASDRLAAGQSTFMVEMVETARILNSATDRSLIILDEVGRGTSTYDGLSLAWAIVEFIHDHIRAKTLFATHYHQLADLEDELERVVNYHIKVQELESEVIFTHKVARGSIDRSFGIYVAKIAGIPMPVIMRAKEVQKSLEESSRLADQSIIPKRKQLTLFDVLQNKNQNAPTATETTLKVDPALLKERELIKKLQNIDVYNITPIEALNELAKLQEEAKKLEK